MNHELELKRAVQSTILDVMDSGGGTVDDVIAAMHEVYPNMCDVYGTGYINGVVKAMFYAELPVVSKAYTALFAQFNRQYFTGRLPEYEVKVFYNVSCGLGCGCICPDIRLIRLRLTRDKRWMISNLLELMAPMVAVYNKEELQKEMNRLNEIGAPVSVETAPGVWGRFGDEKYAEAFGLLGRTIAAANPRGEEMSVFE